MTTLSINHIYGHGFREKDLDFLRQIGFHFRPQESTYAGAQQLRFIDFSDCPYLECIEVTDHQAYREFVPPGMVPYSPGINLCLAEGVKKSIQDFQEEFAAWDPYLLHENYEGDPEKYQPGWNYLNFTNSLVPDTFFWITECEEPYPATHPKTSHPNWVNGVTGLIFNLEEADLTGFSTLTGEPFQEGILGWEGVEIYTRDSSPLGERLPNKEFPLVALILKADTLDYFTRLETVLRSTTIRGQQAIWIETPQQSWELIITS